MFSYEEIKSLNNLEHEVYQYILTNREKVKYMRIRELADGAHVSTTTVLRFCKKIGFEGFSEFKHNFKMYLEETKTEEIKKDSSELIHFFQNTMTEEYQSKLNEVVEVIANKKRIVFLGVGNSGMIASYGARYFSNIGKTTFYINDPFYPAQFEEGSETAVVVLSVSGETKQTVELVSNMKTRNCTIISITNSSNCEVAAFSDYNLNYYISKVNRTYNDVKFDITSQVPSVHLIESIGNQLVKYY